MQHVSEIIISDTSCLIILEKIGELNLLKDFADKVYITPVIADEFVKKLPHWINVTSPQNLHYQKILELELDSGEASAIALSFEINDALLIVDELKGRAVAEKLNLKFTGTLGLLLKAKQTGTIKSLGPIVDKIKRTNFRFNEDLLNFILEEAGE